MAAKLTTPSPRSLRGEGKGEGRDRTEPIDVAGITIDTLYD